MESEFIAQTALDQMVGTDQGQLLKALIPYLPPREQQLFPVRQGKGIFQYCKSFRKPGAACAHAGGFRLTACRHSQRPAQILLRKYQKNSGSNYKYDGYGRNDQGDEQYCARGQL